MPNVAVNGLGRIGRATLKILFERPDIQIVAINDLVEPENLAYLLKYDTVYGRWPHEVGAADGALTIDGRRIPVFKEKVPSNLPWADLDVDLVFECTGAFTTEKDMRQHLDSGAGRVILSAPIKEGNVPTVVYGVNTEDGDGRSMISTASCTTNCIAPVMEVLDRRIGVDKAMLTTIHAYTASQKLVDGPSKKVRRGRAGAENLVPTTTGAAAAAAKALPQFRGRFDGVAIRSPVPIGSISDIVCVTKRDTSVDELRDVFREEAHSDRYREVIEAMDDPVVSSDIVGNDHPSIVDLELIQVVAGGLIKVMAWYDNEWGYAAQMVRQGARMLATEPATT